MDETRRRLLEAIRDAPHDDVPRLVYADWLTEQGDPMGAFIAAQVHKSFDARPMWNDLLREHGPYWASHVHGIPWVLEYFWDRGFVGRVRIDNMDVFVANRREIARWIPIPSIEMWSGGWVTFSPTRTFAALADAVDTDRHGARGTDRIRILDVESGRELARHERQWAEPKARVTSMWFPIGLRTLVIEYGDDTAPTDLRF
ncbi:MAG: TIGR02996 domain-containing protein [Kofleriaceae bacterium]